MAEFQKVIQEFDRMCQYYGTDCEKCPINQFQINAMTHYKCVDFLYINPDIAEDQIMKWSRTHPLPVYPRVREVLNTIATYMGHQTNDFDEHFLNSQINEKCAKCFGIKPINEDKLTNI